MGSGRLRVTAEGAEQLLAAIRQLGERASGELRHDGNAVDQPLHFGDNWVGHVMNTRLRSVARGHARSASEVLHQFG
ncbi:MAG: hypothetical protein ACRDRN_22750 [Sciscionella sp.]